MRFKAKNENSLSGHLNVNSQLVNKSMNITKNEQTQN